MTLRELDRQVTTYAAEHLVEEVREKWAGVPEVSDYLDSVLKDVIENAGDFKRSDEETPPSFMGVPIPRPRPQKRRSASTA